MSLRRGSRRPKFGKDTTVKDRVELLLQEQGIAYDPGKLGVVRWGRGCLHNVIIEERIVGEYDHVRHTLHIFAATE